LGPNWVQMANEEHIRSLKAKLELGDLVEVLGMEGNTATCYWYAEVVGIHLNKNQLEVYYIEPEESMECCSDESTIWKYRPHVDIIQFESINSMVRTKHGDYANAWKKLGFRMEKDEDGNHSFYQTSFFISDDESTSSGETLSSTDTWSTEN
jgi:hypothetical protein